MNTEFPRKKPAQPSTPKASSGSGSGDGSRIPKANNETTPVVDKEVKSTIASKFGKAIEVLNLINTSVVGIYKRVFETLKSESKKKEEEKKDRRSIFSVVKGLNKKWTEIVEPLQKMTDDISSSIGSAMGEVFGSGIFGRTMGSIFSKVLSFAVSKILVGIVLGNLPTILIVGGIVAAVGALIYYAEEIWEGIKWLGMVFDQGIAWIVDIFGKSKYTKAKEGLAKEIGISEEDVLKYYGDTVRGRDTMLEDYRKAIDDPKFKKELIDKIGKSTTVGYVVPAQSLRIDNGAVPTSTIINQYQIQDKLDKIDLDSAVNAYDSLPDPKSLQIPTVVNTTTNNSTSVNTSFGKDISTFYPTSSLSLGGTSGGNLQLSGF